MKIDIPTIKTYLGCDDAFLADLIEKFNQEAVSAMEKISRGAQQKDWTLLRAAAHKMLSSTSIFGLDELTELLQKIEVNAEGMINLDEMSGLVSGFEARCKDAIGELSMAKKELK